MHSMCFWGFLAISCLAVTTVLCQDDVANCNEWIEECKKVAFDKEDDIKRNIFIETCFSNFKCNPGEDSKREDLKKRAAARIEAIYIKRRRWSTNIAPSNKVNFKFIAACLVTVLGLAHF